MLLWKRTYGMSGSVGSSSGSVPLEGEPWKTWPSPPAGFLDLGYTLYVSDNQYEVDHGRLQVRQRTSHAYPHNGRIQWSRRGRPGADVMVALSGVDPSSTACRISGPDVLRRTSIPPSRSVHHCQSCRRAHAMDASASDSPRCIRVPLDPMLRLGVRCEVRACEYLGLSHARRNFRRWSKPRRRWKQFKLLLALSYMVSVPESVLWLAGGVRDAPNTEHAELGYHWYVYLGSSQGAPRLTS